MGNGQIDRQEVVCYEILLLNEDSDTSTVGRVVWCWRGEQKDIVNSEKIAKMAGELKRQNCKLFVSLLYGKASM